MLPIDRRRFHRSCLAAVLSTVPTWAWSQQKNSASSAASPWSRLEAASGGRLGVAVLDTGDGRLDGHRLDERFPLCSTFKWLAAACVLHRVDRGEERLARRIRYGRDELVSHSPVTGPRAGKEGLTLAELCEATITVSDNTAGNLILKSYGGPAALTAYARTLGDTETRLDRWETELNEARPGDPRDTTTPRAMAHALQVALLGEALAPASRAQLRTWMEAVRTNRQRLGAALPEGWRLGSKTGTGARGTTNDVGVYWPPGGRAPIVVAAYLTDAAGVDEAARNGALAGVARQVTGSA